jgi:hypothetical protein
MEMKATSFGLALVLLFGVFFYFYPAIFVGFPLPVFLVILVVSWTLAFVWENRISKNSEGCATTVLLFLVPVLIMTVGFIVTLSYKNRLKEQNALIDQDFQAIVSSIKDIPLMPGLPDSKPTRPYIVLECPFAYGDRPNLNKVHYEVDTLHLGDFIANVDPSYELLNKQPDLKRTRSALIIGRQYIATGKMVKLDRGSIPGTIDTARLFVLDLKSQRLVWESDTLSGGPPPAELHGGGPGNPHYYDSVSGEQIPWATIENRMKQIPWVSID